VTTGLWLQKTRFAKFLIDNSPKLLPWRTGKFWHNELPPHYPPAAKYRIVRKKVLFEELQKCFFSFLIVSIRSRLIINLIVWEFGVFESAVAHPRRRLWYRKKEMSISFLDPNCKIENYWLSFLQETLNFSTLIGIKQQYKLCGAINIRKSLVEVLRF
jgi:hypothetical protein